ncbi:SUKH-4 family immunity protein [Kitasatospora sp. NPDC004745]|uniref:SUKH-4 family immunity protein n=1 Tax=Kitasatospora sp. NPDC004745 TaxID=3364019 RepID=UPI003686E886
MATHAELAELFSPQGVIRLDRREAVRHGIAGADVETLAGTGLPARLDVIFGLDVPGEPSAFSMVPIDTGDQVVQVLCLGGPTGATDMRYCLDLEDGYVILLTLGEEPAAEVVNSTLADFVEFLYRVGLRLEHIRKVTDEQMDEYTRELRTYLSAQDPRAFAEPDSWWSMVFDRLLGEDL